MLRRFLPCATTLLAVAALGATPATGAPRPGATQRTVATPLGAPFAGPVRLAVTFDEGPSSSWVHADPTLLGSLSGRIVSSGGALTQDDPSGYAVPGDVAKVQGVADTDPGSGRLPTFSGTGPYAGYAVTASDFGAADPLAPGYASVTWGADVNVDPGVTADKESSDNGNNVIQRGLAGNDQYKLQVDSPGSAPTASCHVRDSGVETAWVRLSLKADVWYRIRCERTVEAGFDVLTVRVLDLRQGTVRTATTTSTLPAANLDFPEASASYPTPLSIGVKTSARGAVVVSNADQLNGRVDNAYVAIG